jgi:23S rRNA (uracil1939-C5)-methyltransferase
MPTQKPPKIYENLLVENAGSEGKCVARVNGKVIFVDYAVPGDVVNARVYSKKKGVEFAQIIQLVKPSEKRVNTFCSHFGLCGGCKWQQMDYSAQLAYKQQQVHDAFERIGKFNFPELMPIIGADQTQYYRNKLEFNFTARKWLTDIDKKLQPEDIEYAALGYHVPQKFDKVFDVQTCYLMNDLHNQIRNFIKTYCLKHNYSFYHLNEHTGLMRSIILRNNSQNQWMLIVSFAQNIPEKIHSLLNAVKDAFPQIVSLMYVINTKVNDTISDLPFYTYHGDPFLIQTLEDLKFKIGPASFFQTNINQTLKLYTTARQMADIKPNQTVYDLYTGVGSIALFVAKYAKKVVGIEYIEQAVNDAKENARINNITNTAFYAGDLKDVLTPDFLAANGKPDVLITDPPRAGMHQNVIEKLLLVEPLRIVYVSCNPATQARDIALLRQKYKITAVQPVDMFPHTHHVENIALLELL